MTPQLLKLIQQRQATQTEQELSKAQQARDTWTGKVQGLLEFGEDFWATIGMSHLREDAFKHAQDLNNAVGFITTWNDPHQTKVQFYSNGDHAYYGVVSFRSEKWNTGAVTESIRRDNERDHAPALLAGWEKYERAIYVAQYQAAQNWANEFLEQLAEMDSDNGLLRTQLTNKLSSFVNTGDFPAQCKTAPLHKIADKLIDALAVTRSVAREELHHAKEHNSEVAEGALTRILGVAPDYFRGGDFGGFSPDQIPF